MDYKRPHLLNSLKMWLWLGALCGYSIIFSINLVWIYGGFFSFAVFI